MLIVKIIYYTSGVTGSGRVVRGISIGNALSRKCARVDFTILSSSPFAHLADHFGFTHHEIPVEDEDKLTKTAYHDSELFQTLISLNSDLLLVDLLWFPVYYLIEKLTCKKIFLWQRMDERFFTISLQDGTISFNPKPYDLVLAIEPFKDSGPDRQINPLIIRNRDEVLTRQQAIKELKLDENQQNCLLAYNGHPGDFDRVKKRYSYLSDVGYRMVTTTNYKEGLFPVVDYFNAFDLIICGASYNSFWEVIYFDKEAIFVPTRTRFVSCERLIREYREYSFDENGADQLVDIMLNL
ncbi:hypothetical protein ES703_103416 [subsurface metagenome]